MCTPSPAPPSSLCALTPSLAPSPLPPPAPQPPRRVCASEPEPDPGLQSYVSQGEQGRVQSEVYEGEGVPGGDMAAGGYCSQGEASSGWQDGDAQVGRLGDVVCVGGAAELLGRQ